MKKGTIFYTKISKEYEGKKLEHMIGEKLLEKALMRLYGMNLSEEPRSRGEHGKPFFTLEPHIHYNISHSGEYVLCILAPQEVGIDIQIHKKANYERMLGRMVPTNMQAEILDADRPVEAFFTQWVLREAYIKWTGEGLSRELSTIPLHEGWYALLDVAPQYSAAVYSASPMELEWVYEEITLDK